MTYKFECRCGKKLQADEADLGEEVPCPGCGARILLPLKAADPHGYVWREKLARPALILSLLPALLILYAAIETAAIGSESLSRPLFNIAGTLFLLAQVATVALAAIALKRIREARESGSLALGGREATAALVLGAIWLALFAVAILLSLAGL